MNVCARVCAVRARADAALNGVAWNRRTRERTNRLRARALDALFKVSRALDASFKVSRDPDALFKVSRGETRRDGTGKLAMRVGENEVVEAVGVPDASCFVPESAAADEEERSEERFRAIRYIGLCARTFRLGRRTEETRGWERVREKKLARFIRASRAPAQWLFYSYGALRCIHKKEYCASACDRGEKTTTRVY